MGAKNFEEVKELRGRVLGAGFLLSFIHQSQIEYDKRIEESKKTEDNTKG